MLDFKQDGLEVLSTSSQFADRITNIDISKVPPLITMLDNWYVIS